MYKQEDHDVYTHNIEIRISTTGLLIREVGYEKVRQPNQTIGDERGRKI
jgi:hypothetical protein